MSEEPTRDEPGGACPSVDVLESVAEGATLDDEVHAHVDSCASCRLTLDGIRKDNAFLGKVVTALEDDRIQDGTPDDIPGYDVLGELHRGGQGVVYRAVQTSTKRDVALKTLLRGTFATVRQRHRFEREIEVVAAMRHPSIVTVYDSGRADDGRHYYAMEFVEGEPLDRWVEQCDPGVAGTLELFARICDAVSYAHQRGIIHRDLKPANILVDGDASPRVLDFGLAKESAPEEVTAATQAGEFLGTLAYAAPEQVGGDPDQIDTRTDVHALGVVLYQMLTGERPYELGTSLADAIRVITGESPQPPSRLRAEVDDEVDTIVLKALSKEKERRYQSAAEFGADIERYRTGQPILAKGDSGWYLLRKTARRYRVQFAAAGTLLVLIIAFAVAMAVLFEQKAEAESDALHKAELNGKIRFMLETILVGGVRGRDWDESFTVLELIRGAEEEIEAEFADDPEVTASLRHTIGKVYFGLREFDAAARNLELGLEHASLVSSDDDRMAFDIRDLLFDARIAQGRHKAAEEVAHKQLREWTRVEGPRSAGIAVAMEQIGRALFAMQEPGAEQWLRDALVLSEDINGTDDIETARVRVHLANCIQRKRDFEEAELLYTSAIAIYEIHEGRDQEDEATARLALGGMLHRSKRFAEAEPVCRKALRAYRNSVDPKSATLAYALMQLAAVCSEIGKSTESEELYLEAVSIFADRPSEQDPAAYLAHWRLGRLYLARADRDEAALGQAEPMLREAIRFARASIPDHVSLALIEREHGICLRRLGRFAEAEEVLTSAVEGLIRAGPSGEAALPAAIVEMIALHTDWNRPDDVARWSARLHELRK